MKGHRKAFFRKGGVVIIPKNRSLGRQDEGFQQLYRKHYPKVFKQLLFLTGDKVIAEELAQETFIKLYTFPPAVEDNLEGWLARVASNQAFNYFRSEKRRKLREEREAVKQMAGDGVVSLEESLLRKEEVRKVRDCLEKLPDRERLALLLKFSGYCYSEIAATLGIQQGSVGTFLARVKKKFAEIWTAEQEVRK